MVKLPLHKMARAYTKDDVIGAALMRFQPLGVERCAALETMFISFYDEVGKDKFRIYSSVTPEAMKEWFNKC